MIANGLHINPNVLGPVSYHPLEKKLVGVKKKFGLVQ